jgi:ABC-2 type transport system permease protein
MIWRVRLRQIVSLVERGQQRERVRNILLASVFLAFMVSLTYLFYRLFTEFLTIPILGRFVMLQTLSLIFLSFFFLLLFSSMVTNLGTQYMSSDLELLFSKPVDTRVIYWAKWGEALFHSTWMVLVFGYPVLLSYGMATNSPWFFYPVAFLMMFPFVIIPASIGTFVVNSILYLIPIKRVRAIMVAIGIVFGTGMVYVLRLLRPRLLFQPELARNLFMDFIQELRMVEITGLPSYHAAYTLHEITANRPYSSGYHGIVLIGIAIGAVVVFGWLGQRWYLESWLRTQEGRPRQQSMVSLDGVSRLFNMLPNPFRPLMRKETLIFLRETTQWSQLLVLLGIVVVHVLNLSELPGSESLLTYVLYFFNMVLIGFILTAVCVRFVFPSISFEGKPFWIIRSGPVSMTQFFLEKTLFFLVPVGFLGVVLITVTNGMLPIGWDLRLWATVLVGVMSVTLTAGALAFGAIFPKFDYDHFGEVMTSAGSVLYMLCGMFYVAGTVGALLLPLQMGLVDPRFFQVMSRGHWVGMGNWYARSVMFLSLASLALTALLLWMASKAVHDYEFSQI